MIGSYEAEHYLIVLGAKDNSKVELAYSGSNGTTTILSEDEINPLPSTQPRRFWVSWEDMTIRCGYGVDFWSREIFNYRDPYYLTFSGLTMATPFGGTGSWHLSELYGECESWTRIMLLPLLRVA